MASPHTLTVVFLVLAMVAVRGLPTGRVGKEVDSKTSSFVTERPSQQTRTSETKSLEGILSSERITNSDKKLNEIKEQGRSMTSPPEVRLEEWQVKQVLLAKENIIRNGSSVVREKDEPIVNLTEDQIAKLLPHYRTLFHTASELGSLEQQLSMSSELRTRRSTQQRVCPSNSVVTQPNLGINGNGQVVQIVQLNAEDMNQVFFEERCLHDSSPISSARCIQSTRYVTAVVINLETNKIKRQAIGIQSCVAVLYI